MHTIPVWYNSAYRTHMIIPYAYILVGYKYVYGTEQLMVSPFIIHCFCFSLTGEQKVRNH